MARALRQAARRARAASYAHTLWAALWKTPGTTRQTRTRTGLQRAAHCLGRKLPRNNAGAMGYSPRLIVAPCAARPASIATPAGDRCPSPCAGFFSSHTTLPVSALICLVVAISDGDTLTARCGRPGAYHPMKVRIAAIDAPERRQAFGQQSRRHLAQLCWRQRATLQPVDEDRYGRTVANVRCSGTDVATAQVRAGLAWVYVPYAGSHPHLAPLQQQARNAGAGLWSQRRPLAPWNYRQQHQHRTDPARTLQNR